MTIIVNSNRCVIPLARLEQNPSVLVCQFVLVRLEQNSSALELYSVGSTGTELQCACLLLSVSSTGTELQCAWLLSVVFVSLAVRVRYSTVPLKALYDWNRPPVYLSPKIVIPFIILSHPQSSIYSDPPIRIP